MSATADISRYREYFRDLGRGERVEVLAIPLGSGKATMFQHKVSYLEQVFCLKCSLDFPSVSCCLLKHCLTCLETAQITH